MPIRCAELLLQEGQKIYGMISADPAIERWAKAHGLAYFPPTADVLRDIRQQPFDYLFSIVNNLILPPALLDAPRQFSINYHDSPLPKYAGTHATTWAILHREQRHGVTWHRMTATIDTGAILKQGGFEVHPAETALSLNLKCYETAIRLFAELIPELAAQQAVGVPQNLAERSYFGRYQRPSAACVIDWTQPAEQIAALVRALDFGQYPNPLGLPKLCIGNECLAVAKLELTELASQTPPGTILAITPDALTIATGTCAVNVCQVTTLHGQSIPLMELRQRFNLQIGDCCAKLSAELSKRLTEQNAQICRHESFWVKRLTDLQLLALPSAVTKSPLGRGRGGLLPGGDFTASDGGQARFCKMIRPVPGALTSDAVVAALVAYLGRLKSLYQFDLAFWELELRQSLEGLEAFFAPPILRIRLDAAQNFAVNQRAIRTQIEEVKKHHTYPHDLIARNPELRARPELQAPCACPILIVQLRPGEALNIAPAAQLSVGIAHDGTTCTWLADADAVPQAELDRLVACFETFLQNMLARPEHPLAALPLVTAAEQNRLLIEWNQTAAAYPQDACIQQLFEAQVARTPQAVAVVYQEQHLSYQELNQRANQVAHYLRELGVGPEIPVGLCIERSLDMIVGVVGILKAGGAYVPLDPDSPPARLEVIRHDAEISVVLTQSQLAQKFSPSGVTVVCLDAPPADIARQRQDNPAQQTTSAMLAYILYTSGSTGIPKGVMIAHQSVSNLGVGLYHAIYAHQAETQLRVSVNGPLAFDTSVKQIIQLLYGHTLDIVPAAIRFDRAALLAYFQTHAIDVFDCTPSQLKLLLTDVTALGRLPKVVLLGGEPLDEPTWQILAQAPQTAFYNLYGPTECTVDATVSPLQRTTPRPTIGRPLANTQVYILDPHSNPVPPGFPGELHIGGQGLARGYLNRPDLTAEKFVPHPFGAQPDARLYKTGDAARYWPDGQIEFLGRLDRQVKIRGFRIELSEIEAALAQHPAVRAAVVTVRVDIPDNPQLAAYVVAREESAATSSVLRSFLKERLPDYMLPASFVRLDALPLTPNGKVNRQALPAPEMLRPTWLPAYVAPRNTIEATLAEIWAKTLLLDQVGMNDNFFTLGGNSLHAVQLISRLRETFQVELALSRLADMPTLAALARYLEDEDRALAGQAFWATTIRPVSRDRAFALSFAQERLWLFEQLYPGTPVYNIPFAFRLTGPLKLPALEQSSNELVRRHEALRTNFVTTSAGEPIQQILPASRQPLPISDLEYLPIAERAPKAAELMAAEARRPFDLTQDSLLRANLWRIAATEHLLLLNIHHIVFDAWSEDIFFRELTELYQAFLTARPARLPALPIQYADFAAWQREWLQGEVLAAQLAYWKSVLETKLPVLTLPIDHPRPPRQTFRGATYTFEIAPAVCADIRTLCQTEAVTLFMTLLAAFTTLLHRYAAQTEIVVGVPTANRTRRELEGLIGFFVNMLVLRTDVAGNPSFQELLKRVRAMTLAAYDHQDVPLEKLVEMFAPERELSRTPFFQVMFSLQNTPAPVIAMPGLTVQRIDVETNTAKFDLTLFLKETGQGLTGTLEYNTDLFETATISRMAGHFRTLLASIAAHPEGRLSELALLTEPERQQLLVAWNDTNAVYPHNQCLPQLFEAQVARTPNAFAVVYEDQQLTYGELNQRANQLAHHLRAFGVGPDVLVGICVERSVEMVVGLLGILKAGGAYVPLEPDYPQARLAFMLEDSQVTVLVTQQRLAAKFPPSAARRVWLDHMAETDAGLRAVNPCSGATGEHLAYLIYTSGSTGQPKGVQIPHRALRNCLQAMQRQPGFTAQDRLLAVTTLSFDIAGLELFLPLITGGQVIVASRDGGRDGAQLAALIAATGVTVMQATPATWRLLLAAGWHGTPGLKALCGGEALSRDLAAQLLPRVAALWNMYGPTETTIWSVIHRVESAETTIPLGQPIANTQCYILEPSLMPTPVGIPGELHLGGEGVAHGYFRRPALTAEKFIPNPFAGIGACLYKTGDLARYLPDGTLEFLGRRDQQVKIRGFRIELEEIEAVLATHPAIREVVVNASDTQLGDQQLAAYLVPTPHTPPTVDELQRFLREKLPEYMIPARFLYLDALPLTANGKIDRQALPLVGVNSLSGQTAYVAPRTPVEELIAGLWTEVMKIPAVGIHDNFFHVGGHSLLGTQIIARMCQMFRVNLPLRSLFDAPTVAGLAEALCQYESTPGQVAAIARLRKQINAMSADDIQARLDPNFSQQ